MKKQQTTKIEVKETEVPFWIAAKPHLDVLSSVFQILFYAVVIYYTPKTYRLARDRFGFDEKAVEESKSEKDEGERFATLMAAVNERAVPVEHYKELIDRGHDIEAVEKTYREIMINIKNKTPDDATKIAERATERHYEKYPKEQQTAGVT